MEPIEPLKAPKTCSMMPFPVRASVTRPIARPSIAKRPFNFSLKTLVWSTVLLLSAMVKISSSTTVTFREALREALGESDHFGFLPSFLRRVLRHLFTEGSGVDWIIDWSRETPGVLSCWDSVRELLSNFLNGFFSFRLTFTQKKIDDRDGWLFLSKALRLRYLSWKKASQKARKP